MSALEEHTIFTVKKEVEILVECLLHREEFTIPGLSRLSEQEQVKVVKLRRKGIHTEPGKKTNQFIHSNSAKPCLIVVYWPIKHQQSFSIGILEIFRL